MIVLTLRKQLFSNLSLCFPFSRQVKTKGFKREQSQQLKFTQQDRMRIYKNSQNIYLHGMTPSQIHNSSQGVKRVFRADNATPHQILKNRLALAVKKFQKSAIDTGSAAVQCACMSEKIIVCLNHCKQHAQDKKAGRYLRYLIEKRRTMLNYLMITDYHYYKWVCMEYAIPEVFPRNAHHQNNFRGQKNGAAGI